MGSPHGKPGGLSCRGGDSARFCEAQNREPHSNPPTPDPNCWIWLFSDFSEKIGESGIRTHETIARLHAFQACSLSHSDISPNKAVIEITSFLFLKQEAIAKRHARGKSMILDGPCKDGKAGRAVSGRPQGAPDDASSLGTGETIPERVGEPMPRQGTPKGRFYTAKGFAIGSQARSLQYMGKWEIFFTRSYA